MRQLPVRSGFQPFSSNALKPRITSCNETVPLVGSPAPKTQAIGDIMIRHKVKANIFTITMTTNDNNLIADVTGNRSHSVPNGCHLRVD